MQWIKKEYKRLSLIGLWVVILGAMYWFGVPLLLVLIIAVIVIGIFLTTRLDKMS